jgi:hypothetical protein
MQQVRNKGNKCATKATACVSTRSGLCLQTHQFQKK